MPRRPRIASGGYAYHVLNRAVGRWKIFRKEEDYAAFERVLEQVQQPGGSGGGLALGQCPGPKAWERASGLAAGG